MFEQMAEATAAILYLYDEKECRNLYVNQRISDILGYSSPEIQAMGSQLFELLIHPDDFVQVAIGLKQLLTTKDGGFFETEYRMKHANGEWRWLCSRNCVFGHDAEGIPQQILGTAIDITRLKQAEARTLTLNAELEQRVAERTAKLNRREQELAAEIDARQQLESHLRASQAQLSHVLDSAVASITSLRVFADRTWQYDYWSAGCEIIFGYTAQELLVDQTLWTANVWTEDWETVLKPGFDHILAERAASFEYRFRHQDGSIRWISTHLTSRRDHEQDCWIVTAVEVDISERKQIEEALRQQIQRSQLFAEVTQKIRQSLQLEEILRTTVTEVQRILNADRVLLYQLLPNGSGKVVEEAVVAGWRVTLGEEISDPCFPNYTQHYRQGRISSIADITAADIQPCHVEFLQQFDVRSNLVVPVLQADKLWGLLIAHQCDRPRQWSAFETELLQQLANQVGIAIQQSQLYCQTQQQAQRSQALNRVVQTIRQSLDLPTIFAAATAEIAQLLNAERTVLVQYFPERQCWRHVAEYRKSPDILNTIGLEIPDVGNPLADQLRRFEVVRVSDTDQIDDEINREVAQKVPGAWLLVPLVVGGVLWGSLSSKTQRSHAWTDEQADLAQTVADQLAIAIQQANLYQQTQQDLADRKRVESELQQLNQELEDRVQERSAQLQLAISAARIGTWEWDLVTNVEYWSPEIYAMFDVYNDGQGNVFDHNGGKIIASPTYELFQNCVHPDDFHQIDRAHQLALEQRSLFEAEFRIIWQDGTIHWCQSRGAYIYNEQGQAIKMVGMSIDTTTRKQSEIALQQQVERERLISSITERIRASLDLKEILHRTVNEIQQVVYADRVLIYRIFADGQIAAISEAVADCTSILDRVYPPKFLPIERHPAYLQGQIHVLNDLEQESVSPDLTNFLKALGVRARLVVPIVQKEALWGLLVAHQCKPRQWQPGEIELLQQIADQLSIAIQQADLYQQVQIELGDRQFAEARLRSSLREKEVLLQEIHHRVKNNMQLVSSLLNLQASAIHDPQILEPFQESQQRIKVMALIHEQLYRANNLAKINFSTYVKNLAASLFQSLCTNPSRIQFKVDVVAVELDIDIAIPCGLMINELVSNAIKYAFQKDRLGEITIQFSPYSDAHPDRQLDDSSDQQYMLTVQDNGVGMPIAVDVHNTDSLGLQVVCALTEQLEGRLIVNRENGTAFQIVFPVPVLRWSG
ncbi:GAF domain-containing protein [Phormidesmis sp. 146-12]